MVCVCVCVSLGSCGLCTAEDTGEIDARYLQDALVCLGLCSSLAEAHRVMKEIDVDGSGTVSYPEMRDVILGTRSRPVGLSPHPECCFPLEWNNHTHSMRTSLILLDATPPPVHRTLPCLLASST